MKMFFFMCNQVFVIVMGSSEASKTVLLILCRFHVKMDERGELMDVGDQTKKYFFRPKKNGCG